MGTFVVKAGLKKGQQGQKIYLQETPLLKSLLIRPWTVIFFLSTVAVIIYSNTFSASFHFDDIHNIVDKPWIKNFSNLLDLSGTRYVGFFSFALNYHFGRLNVFGYHLVNLLIHITNGILVYFFVLLLLRIPQPSLTPHASPLTPPGRILDRSRYGITVCGSSYPDSSRDLHRSTLYVFGHPVLSACLGLILKMAIG